MISFSPSSLPLQQRWRNNGLSADFVANYLASFFPVNEHNPSSLSRQVSLKGAVSYIANELLENAMKFHEEMAQSPITFGIHLLGETVILFSTNCITQKTIKSLQDAIEELLSSDSANLYINKMERLAEQEDKLESGLGFITIMHDYEVTMGWKIEASLLDSDLSTLTTMVQIQF